MSRIYFAAGAHTVWPLMNPTMEPATTLEAALAQLPDDLPAQRLNPYGSHPQSTCRASADAKRGVCKPDGETHEVKQLYIADGSIFPNAVGVNPQITILSLATLIARGVAAKG
jgi:choline dehydrogenase-like flavoprotein